MKLLFSVIFSAITLFSAAQSAPAVIKLSLGDNTSGTIKGDLAKGVSMEDLSWAWSSANACFPETQKRKFTGHHVLYQFDLPTRTEAEITVVPDDKSADFSIYAYQVAKGKEAVVPDLKSCIRCEADHKWDYKKKGKTQDHTRTVTDILSISEPYTVFIGVAGANGLKKGSYTLMIKLKK